MSMGNTAHFSLLPFTWTQPKKKKKKNRKGKRGQKPLKTTPYSHIYLSICSQHYFDFCVIGGLSGMRRKRKNEWKQVGVPLKSRVCGTKLQSHISLISADEQNNKKAEVRDISSCFRYGYVYIRVRHIKELRSSKRMELFKHHFMQISVMNCVHAHEQHVFVYNI